MWLCIAALHDLIAYYTELRLLAAGIKPSYSPYIHSHLAANLYDLPHVLGE